LNASATRYVVLRLGGAVKLIREHAKGFHEVAQRVHHSPSGMEYGYGGSGPADLALTMLDDYFTVTGKASGRTVEIYKGKTVGAEAWRWHQDFKFSIVGNMKQHEPRHEVTFAEIDAWLHLNNIVLASDEEDEAL
jgi:hypothetical protein